MPVIGALISTSPDLNADYLRAFREGLKETSQPHAARLHL
jgi:hypothetical protein